MRPHKYLLSTCIRTSRNDRLLVGVLNGERDRRIDRTKVLACPFMFAFDSHSMVLLKKIEESRFLSYMQQVFSTLVKHTELWATCIRDIQVSITFVRERHSYVVDNGPAIKRPCMAGFSWGFFGSWKFHRRWDKNFIIKRKLAGGDFHHFNQYQYATTLNLQRVLKSSLVKGFWPEILRARLLKR